LLPDRGLATLGDLLHEADQLIAIHVREPLL